MLLPTPKIKVGTVWSGNQNRRQDGNQFVWARNNGSGNFTILNNVQQGNGDFLQGVAVANFQSGSTDVILSWHARTSAVQRLSVPGNPSSGTWSMGQLPPASQFDAHTVETDLAGQLFGGRNILPPLAGNQMPENCENDQGNQHPRCREGALRGSPATALQKTDRVGNP